MSVPFSVVKAGAQSRKAARVEESRNKGASRKASTAASQGPTRAFKDKKSIEAERYLRQMGLL